MVHCEPSAGARTGGRGPSGEPFRRSMYRRTMGTGGCTRHRPGAWARAAGQASGPSCPTTPHARDSLWSSGSFVSSVMAMSSSYLGGHAHGRARTAVSVSCHAFCDQLNVLMSVSCSLGGVGPTVDTSFALAAHPSASAYSHRRSRGSRTRPILARPWKALRPELFRRGLRKAQRLAGGIIPYAASKRTVAHPIN